MKKLIISILLAASLLLAVPTFASAEIEVLGRDAAYTTILVEGVIWEGSFGEFVKATAYGKDINYRLLIHTNGGNAHSTIAIMNRIEELKRRGCTFTTEVYGKAFSAGAYLFLMGDERIVHENASLMFHSMMQQVTDAQAAQGRVTHPSTVAMIERLDRAVGKRFREVANAGEETADYFLNGYPDDSGVLEGAQYMSALTAYNIGVATDYINN